MKFVKYLIIFLLLTLSLQAQSITKSGTTSAQFLKIGVGSRALGMGGAFTATSNDITAMFWNPAGLTSIQSNEAVFSHVNWIADINFDYAGYATTIPGFGTLGAFVTILSTDEMLVRTEAVPEGTGEYFNFSDLAIGLSFAKSLTENFSIGFNAKYIGENLWHMSAKSFALDIGTIYKIKVLNELRIAASISNFGTKMKLEGRDILAIKQVGSGDGNLLNTDIQLDEFELPLLFRFGIASDIIKSENMRLTTAIDAIHPNDHTEYLNAGAELAWNEIFFMRAGYNSLFENNTEKGFTLGVGINYNLFDFAKIKVDYAYQDFGILNNVQYFTLGLNF